MAKDNNRNPEYLKTKREWYIRLKEAGFNDIEYDDGSIQSCLIRTTDGKLKDMQQIEDAMAYYAMCAHFLNDHTFDTELEKVIWTYHSEGMTVREISRVLTSAKIRRHKKDTVHQIVRRLESIMRGLYLQT